MGSLFEDIRDGIRDGIAMVADKTDEYAKIGKLKVDILGIERNIDRLFSELGGRVYEMLTDNPDCDTSGDQEVKRLVSEIKDQEAKLKLKKQEIETIKAEKERQRKTNQQQQAPTSQTEPREKADSSKS
jgi:hypothetical protein